MTSLHEPASGADRLPADQRAVLQMVLARGQSYDEIAGMLSIDRSAVRQRALAALDALGPATRVAAQRRALITDYLLGQLPARVSDEVRDHLARSASERAWARVVASELAPLAITPLPEIPVGEPSDEAGVEESHAEAAVSDGATAVAHGDELDSEPPRRVSRVGGAILLGAVAAAAIAAILIFAVFGVGSGSSHPQNVANGTTSGTTTPAGSSTTSRPVAQINLFPPTHGKARGVAEIVKAGKVTGVVIVAQGLAPNAHGNAYAVWLYSSPRHAIRLGYVKPPVGSKGTLQTAGRLPSNAGSYKQIVVALQHGPSNKPGKIVLRGPLSGV